MSGDIMAHPVSNADRANAVAERTRNADRLKNAHNPAGTIRRRFLNSAADVAATLAVATAVIGGTALFVANVPDRSPNTNTNQSNLSPEDQIAAQEQKAAQESGPYVYKDGEFYVDAGIVNDMHVATFGGAAVSPEFKSYKIQNAELVRNPDGNGWTLQVQGIDVNGLAIPEPLPADPGAELFGGPPSGAVKVSEGSLVPLASNDAADISVGMLSQVTGSTEPVPTSPGLPAAPSNP